MSTSGCCGGRPAWEAVSSGAGIRAILDGDGYGPVRAGRAWTLGSRDDRDQPADARPGTERGFGDVRARACRALAEGRGAALPRLRPRDRRRRVGRASLLRLRHAIAPRAPRRDGSRPCRWQRSTQARFDAHSSSCNSMPFTSRSACCFRRSSAPRQSQPCSTSSTRSTLSSSAAPSSPTARSPTARSIRRSRIDHHHLRARSRDAGRALPAVTGPRASDPSRRRHVRLHAR